MKTIIRTLVILLVICNLHETSAQNAKQLYKTGLTFMKAGNYQDAINQFTKALELDPEFTEAYVERSRSFEAKGDMIKAAEDLERALVFSPKNGELLFDAARVGFQLQNLQHALELATAATNINKKSESSFRLLSRIQMAMEDYSGALISVNKALAIKDNPENYFTRGQVFEKMKNYSQAVEDFNKTIAEDALFFDAYLAMANLQLNLNKYAEALTCCNTLLTKDNKNKNALLIRSRIYARQNEFNEAVDDVSGILAGDPENKEMYLTRGTYYFDFTQYQNAINDFSRALLLDPNYAEALFKRASSFEHIGDFKSAIKDYETLTALSSNDLTALQHLTDARKRLYELNRESTAPKISLLDPQVFHDSTLNIARNKNILAIRGRIADASDISTVLVNKKPVTIFKSGEFFEFSAEVDVAISDFIFITASDVYNNESTNQFELVRTEIEPPLVSILAPYASDNGEIYLDTDNASLYIEGIIKDESHIKTILIDGVAASFPVGEVNPHFSATINVANKNKFTVTATDIYDNDTLQTFVLNREGVSLLEANPMGRTWVVFIENSNYETFPSLDGPAKDVTLMRSALARYDIQKLIHKQDMSKKEMERFFSIELRDLLRSNKVNALLIWYAGHGKFINETGYWIPVDAKRDDEFTYYNLNALRASLQSYTNYITHNLIITDACESGPTFYQAMREAPKERNCNDWEAVKFRSSQVFSSAGYELAVDNSIFTRTFANTLANNPNACIPIETIVNKVNMAVTQSNQQKPKFGKIAGLDDEDGTFFFMSKK